MRDLTTFFAFFFSWPIGLQFTSDLFDNFALTFCAHLPSIGANFGNRFFDLYGGMDLPPYI